MADPNDVEDNNLRRREVEASEKSAAADHRAAKGALRAAKYQAIATIVSTGVVLAALGGLYFTQEQVQLTREGIQRQAALDDRRALDERLAIAISAVGSDTAAGRIAGITLLQRNALTRVEIASEADASPDEREDAVRTYSIVLDIMENYLRDPGLIAADGSSGIGWGQPVLPPEQGYVTTRLRSMLDELPEVNRLLTSAESAPAIDLTGAQLYKVSWREIDFHLLRGRSLSGADMRGALLGESNLEEVDLRKTFLQCANFAGSDSEHAILRGADLRGADLRGADVSFADFSGANLEGANLSGANLYGADFTGARTEGMVTVGAFGTGQTVGQTFGVGAVGTFGLPGCLSRREYDAPH